MTTYASRVPDEDDLELVRASLDRLADYSNVAAAELLQVSEATVRRWRAGSVAVPLRTATRLALRDFVGQRTRPAGGGRSGPPAQEEPDPADAGAEPPELFGSVSRVRSYIGGIAPPGSGQARKRDVLEGIRQVITARSPVPDWWYRLWDDVEGETL